MKIVYFSREEEKNWKKELRPEGVSMQEAK